MSSKQLYTGTIEFLRDDVTESIYERLPDLSLKMCRQLANLVGCNIAGNEYISFQYSPNETD